MEDHCVNVNGRSLILYIDGWWLGLKPLKTLNEFALVKTRKMLFSNEKIGLCLRGKVIRNLSLILLIIVVT